MMTFKLVSILIKINLKGSLPFYYFSNIEEYLKLFNSMQVTKNQKKKNYNTLQLKYGQMNI